jgi:nitroreductase
MNINTSQKMLLVFAASILSITPGCISKKSEDQTCSDISALLLKRHSGYAYDPAKIVTQDQIKAIIKAGQLTPSSYNDQPWDFIVCDRNTNPDAYEKVFSALVEFNQQWAKNAPVLIVSVASTNSHEGTHNRWAQYDTGAAAYGMMLQATSLGLMAHQMGGFDPEKIINNFGIPKDFVPMAVMAIGFEVANEVAKPKERKPLEENFFMGTWGK